jgi:small-conductance mechanosensitive channel/predicted  nucleic acid-binding Zn-ribbon protein
MSNSTPGTFCRVATKPFALIFIAFSAAFSCHAAHAAVGAVRIPIVGAGVPVFRSAMGWDDPKNRAGVQSEAERLASLDRVIEAETKRLHELETELNNPNSEYADAEQAFQEIDKELEEARDQLAEFKKNGKTREAALLERSIKAAETQWKLAKDRFEIAIEERKTMRDEIATLKAKLQKDRDELAEASGSAESKESDSATTEHAHAKSDPKAPEAKTDGAASSEAAAATETTAESDEPTDEELVRAQADAKDKEKEAKEAQHEVQEIASRISDLQKIVTQEKKALELARKKADLALTTQQTLEAELAKKQSEGASNDELQGLRQQIADANARLLRARQDAVELADRLDNNRAEQASLQQEQIIALQTAEKKRLEADAAKETVDDLRNPFAVRNMLKWLIEHGPKVVMYFIAMIVMLQSAKFFSHRIIRFMTGGGGRGSTIERENRAKTLVGVFQNAASVTIVIGGSLIILEEMGAKVGVLLGGVAVAGLAVAFGAQNLIKDYFYGFVMLLENQYMLNDVVKIGDLTGQVERITLRMTVLRDANGVVHFIPNGQINCVSNETHGWSRAAFDIGVAYKENVDHCITVLSELAMNMRQDPVFGPMIIDEPTPPAVDQLADSSVVIKFFIKTRPHQQGTIRRELLRRIKNRFDALGIEMPFPQRTVYHRYEEGTPVAPVVQPRKVA